MMRVPVDAPPGIVRAMWIASLRVADVATVLQCGVLAPRFCTSHRGHPCCDVSRDIVFLPLVVLTPMWGGLVSNRVRILDTCQRATAAVHGIV